MITSIFTILLLVALIGSIVYGRKLTKTEKIDSVSENPKRAKARYHWVVAGSCAILLLWLYFSWDIARAFYPDSANALCQVAKVNQSLIAINYIFPIEERTLSGTAIIQRENKVLDNLKSEIEKTSLADKDYLIYLINEIDLMIISLADEKNLKPDFNDKLVSVANKINILTDSIQKPDYPSYQSLSDEELEGLKKQASWETAGMEVPFYPTTERGLRLDAAAKEMDLIVDELFQIRNDNPIFLEKSKKIKEEIKNYRDSLEENQKIEIEYIREISKISARVIKGNIFPPNTLDEIEKAVKKFDKNQKRERGLLRMVDTWLFPTGTIVASDSSCSEQGSGRWLPKPTDTLRIFLHLLKPSERNLK